MSKKTKATALRNKTLASIFNDLMHLCDQSTGLSDPVSKGMGIRFAVRALRRFTERNIIMLVHDISQTMEREPDGVCDPPLRPTDGKY
jgi:hypothetical protein